MGDNALSLALIVGLILLVKKHEVEKTVQGAATVGSATADTVVGGVRGLLDDFFDLDDEDDEDDGDTEGDESGFAPL